MLEKQHKQESIKWEKWGVGWSGREQGTAFMKRKKKKKEVIMTVVTKSHLCLELCQGDF